MAYLLSSLWDITIDTGSHFVDNPLVLDYRLAWRDPPVSGYVDYWSSTPSILYPIRVPTNEKLPY